MRTSGMKHRNSLFTAAATAVVGLTLVGCTSTARDAPAGDTDTELTPISVAVASTSCVNSYPAYTALEEGFFAANGLDVTIQPLDGSSAVLQALSAGQVQIANPSPSAALSANAEGNEVVLFFNGRSSSVFTLIATSDSGLTGPADMRGKTIGVATADGGEVAFVKSLLQREGLSEGDYTLLTVGEGGQAVAGFSRGDIDAYAANPANFVAISSAGLDVVDITGESTEYLFGNGFATTRDYLDENADILGAWGNAAEQGIVYGAENPERVVELCGKYQPQEVEDPDYAAAIIEISSKSYVPSDLTAIGAFNDEYWQRQYDDLVAADVIDPSLVDYKDVYTNDLVPAFNE